MNGKAQHMAGGATLAGLLAGLVYGLFLHVGTERIPVLGGLIGVPTLLAGWLVHLGVSVVLAWAYAALVSNTALARWGHRLSGGWMMGLVYGIAVWIVAASLLMPLWTNAVGAVTLPVPDFSAMLFVGHLVYGAVLGVAYPLVATRTHGHARAA